MSKQAYLTNAISSCHHNPSRATRTINLFSFHGRGNCTLQHSDLIWLIHSSLNPTYRGKIKKDAKPLDKNNIKRVSIMMRRQDPNLLSIANALTFQSFFGTQKGGFSLTIGSIKALKETPSISESNQQPISPEKAETAKPSPRHLPKVFARTVSSSPTFNNNPI